MARLRDNGRLEPKSDLDQLTMSTVAAVQGGLLLAKASRDSGQLGVVLDTAIAQLRTHAPASA